MWKRLILILTLGCLAGIFVIPLNPVNSKLLKVALLGCFVGTNITVLAFNALTKHVIAALCETVKECEIVDSTCWNVVSVGTLI